MTTWTVPALVKRVIDADTLVCDLDVGWGFVRRNARVRLAGINAPELSTSKGVAARTFAADAIFAFSALDELAPVTVISQSLDKYGRTLAVVKLADGRILNDLLVEAGYAVRVKA